MSPDSAVPKIQDAAGGQCADTFNHRQRFGDRAHRQEARKCIAIHPGRDGTTREQRANFRSEGDSALDLHEIQRLHTDAIADEEEPTFNSIQHCERELAAKTRHGVRAPALPCFEDDLGVAGRPESVTKRLELLAKIQEIEDLAIEDNLVPAAAAAHRLMPGGTQIEDGESSMGEPTVLPVEDTGPGSLVVRPAMVQRFQASRELNQFGDPRFRSHEAEDAAHGVEPG